MYMNVNRPLPRWSGRYTQPDGTCLCCEMCVPKMVQSASNCTHSGLIGGGGEEGGGWMVGGRARALRDRVVCAWCISTQDPPPLLLPPWPTTGYPAVHTPGIPHARSLHSHVHSIPSGFLVVFEKPSRSSCTFTFAFTAPGGKM